MPVNEASALFFRALDHRIDSKDSPHDEASKDRMRKARIQLAILAANDPGGFDEVVTVVLKSRGILSTPQPSTTQPSSL